MNDSKKSVPGFFKALLVGFGLTTFILMTGCQQTKQEVKKVEPIPEWFIAPSQDNTESLYGVGDGKTKAEAIESALSNLAGKLGTEIQASSTLVKTQYTLAYRYDEEVNQQSIESTIHKITLNQYKVVELVQRGYQQFLVLVSSNKLLLSNSLQQTLDQQIAEYGVAKKGLSNRTGFSHFQFYAEQQQGLETFKNNLSALLTLKNVKYLKKYQGYQRYPADVMANLTQSQQQTVFYIDYQPEAQYVQKALSDKLLQAGFRITDSTQEATNVIEVVTRLKENKAYEFTILREMVELKTTEASQSVGGNQFSLKGQGLNLLQAKQQLAINFKKQLQPYDLATVLGLIQE